MAFQKVRRNLQRLRKEWGRTHSSNPEKYEVWMVTPIGRTKVTSEGKDRFTKEEAEKLLFNLKYTFPEEAKQFYIKKVETSSNPVPIGVRGVDSSLEAMKDEQRRKWREKGYSEGLIAKALLLAQEWTYKMSVAFAPPEAREAAMRHNLPKGLDVADRWIKTMSL